MLKKSIITCFLLVSCFFSYAQVIEFKYIETSTFCDSVETSNFVNVDSIWVLYEECAIYEGVQLWTHIKYDYLNNKIVYINENTKKKYVRYYGDVDDGERSEEESISRMELIDSSNIDGICYLDFYNHEWNAFEEGDTVITIEAQKIDFEHELLNLFSRRFENPVVSIEIEYGGKRGILLSRSYNEIEDNGYYTLHLKKELINYSYTDKEFSFEDYKTVNSIKELN